jgi:biotin carboxylase
LGHSFQRAHYDANIVYTGKNRESFAKLLEPFKAGSLKVVAAAESGVALYDEVLDLLGTPNTEQVPGKVLRNKFRMAETAKKFLHEVGVETIPGIASSDAGTALQWMRREGISFPVFVKPTESGGSFGGGVCASAGELTGIFSKLIGQRDPMWHVVDQLLVQPVIQADGLREVVANGLFDRELGFIATDFFEYKKQRGRQPIYIESRLKKWDLSDPVHVKILKASQALGEAFKLGNAAFHGEFFVIGDRVLFIEFGLRAAGGGMPQFVRACGGMDQIRLHLLSLFDRKQFLKTIRADEQRVGSLPLIAPQVEVEGNMIDLRYEGPPGIVQRVPSDALLSAMLPGFYSASLHMKVGDWLESTSDLFNGPGVISVRGNQGEIAKAERALRLWEREGFYGVKEPGLCRRILFRLFGK